MQQSTSEQPPPLPTPATEATRYLCAANYYDFEFREQVIREFSQHTPQATGTSPGVDMVPVIAHAYLSRRTGLMVVILHTLLLVVTLGASIGVFVATQEDYYDSYYGYSYQESHPEYVLPVLAIGLLIAAVITFWETRSADRIVHQNFLRHSYNPGSIASVIATLSPEIQNKLNKISQAQYGNIIAYSNANFRPFIGSGFFLNGWSFVVDLRKGKQSLDQEQQPVAFSMPDINQAIDEGLKQLELPDLYIKDQLFVRGSDMRTDATWMLPNIYDSPLTHVELPTVQYFMENPTFAIRHYKLIQVLDWHGQLVPSMFLRFTRSGHNLFIEASYIVLTPLDKKFRRIDEATYDHTLLQNMFAFAGATFQTIFKMMAAPFRLINFIISTIFQRKTLSRREQRQIRENPVYDYGASRTIREKESAPVFQHYFQRMDEEKHSKLIEHNVLDIIVKFLDSKNIDTYEITQRQAQILNEGVIISNANIEAQNLGIGGKEAGNIITNTAQAVGGAVRRAAGGGNQQTGNAS